MMPGGSHSRKRAGFANDRLLAVNAATVAHYIRAAKNQPGIFTRLDREAYPLIVCGHRAILKALLSESRYRMNSD